MLHYSQIAVFGIYTGIKIKWQVERGTTLNIQTTHFPGGNKASYQTTSLRLCLFLTNEIFEIFIIMQYLSPFYPSDHNIMKEAGSI
jgi:hypothetical protein